MVFTFAARISLILRMTLAGYWFNAAVEEASGWETECDSPYHTSSRCWLFDSRFVVACTSSAVPPIRSALVVGRGVRIQPIRFADNGRRLQSSCFFRANSHSSPTLSCDQTHAAVHSSVLHCSQRLVLCVCLYVCLSVCSIRTLFASCACTTHARARRMPRAVLSNNTFHSRKSPQCHCGSVL